MAIATEILTDKWHRTVYNAMCSLIVMCDTIDQLDKLKVRFRHDRTNYPDDWPEHVHSSVLMAFKLRLKELGG